MKSRNILAALLLFSICIISSAQSPGRLNYQGVARDASGEPYTNQLIGLRFTILTSSSVAVYTETQALTSNEFGLINAEIGDDNQAAFATVDWGADSYSLKVELDLENNGSWEMETTKPLSSVPYALYGEDADANPANELQTLSISGKQISISDGNSITLPTDPDESTSNEIQTLGISGNQLSISSGNTVDLPTGTASPWVTSGSNIYYNEGLVGIGTADPDAKLQVAYSEQRTLAAGHWLDISSCSSGYGLLGGNVYLRDSDNSFRFSRTHPTLGASGVGLNALGGSPGWNSVGIFANAGPSVIDQAFSPNWIASFRANGNVGIGTTTPESRLEVNVSSSWADEDPLFEVKNKDGVPVFAVYNNGVRVLVNDDPADLKARTRGGFAVAGFDRDDKGYVETYNYMRITPDSIRFNIDNSAVGKAPGTRGGFAVGGFDRDDKGTINEDFMYLTPRGSGNGNYNTLLGYKAGDNETGEDNVMIGYAAGISSTYASNNIFIGKNAGGNSNGSYNVFMGEAAGRYEGGQYNVYIGHAAGSKVPSDPRFPYESVSYNTAIGYYAGLRNTGQGLVAMGWSAGQLNRGDLNTFIGAESGMYNTTGVSNTFLGFEAGWKTTTGSTNVFIGTCAGRDNTIGENNIFIGNYAGATQNVSDRLFIDNNDTNLPLIFGAFDINLIRIHGNLQYTGSLSHYSDISMKEGINTLGGTLEKIKKIRGVSFYWNEESQSSLDMGTQRQIGVIAQEVEQVYPELICLDESGNRMVDYIKLSPILLQAVKEQQVIIEDQESRIIGLENELEELKAMVAALLEVQK